MLQELRTWGAGERARARNALKASGKSFCRGPDSSNDKQEVTDCFRLPTTRPGAICEPIMRPRSRSSRSEFLKSAISVKSGEGTRGRLGLC